jgi:NTP pyrophosphatase (non-canonical NTP hydrolase)
MTYDDVAAQARAFRDERDWAQFHNPKDLALSISLEAAELLEVFQWSGTDLQVESKRAKAEEELADVLIYCLFMADALGVDPAEIMAKKLAKNAEHYPVSKARGTARKYDEL